MICPEGNIQHRFHYETDKSYMSLVVLSPSFNPKQTQSSEPSLQA